MERPGKRARITLPQIPESPLRALRHNRTEFLDHDCHSTLGHDHEIRTLEEDSTAILAGFPPSIHHRFDRTKSHETCTPPGAVRESQLGINVLYCFRRVIGTEHKKRSELRFPDDVVDVVFHGFDVITVHKSASASRSPWTRSPCPPCPQLVCRRQHSERRAAHRFALARRSRPCQSALYFLYPDSYFRGKVVQTGGPSLFAHPDSSLPAAPPSSVANPDRYQTTSECIRRSYAPGPA